MRTPSLFSRRTGQSVLRMLWHRWHRHLSRPRLHALRGIYTLRLRAVLHLRHVAARVSSARQARLYVDGKRAFARIERLLHRARHTVLIQMFIWKDDATGRRIAAALVAAADRGVQVEITKETTGDVFEMDQNLLGTNTAGGIWERFWQHPSITVTAANNNDHAKTYVIDGHTLLLGGMNIGDEYAECWHDFLVELKGESFVRQYLNPSPWTLKQEPVRIVVNRPDCLAIRPALEWILSSAKKSLVVEHAYLSDERVLALLAQRSREGVTVSVILPQRPDVHSLANNTSINYLFEHGRPGKMRVYTYPGMQHGKLILADRRRAFIGSANLMRTSLDEMGEVNVLLQGRHLPAVVAVREALREDLSRSTPLLRPPALTVVGRLFGWVGL